MSLPPGHRIGDYEVLDRLGSGAFGITYRVRDAKLGLQFALKEYFPTHLARRQEDGSVRARDGQGDAFLHGLSRFLAEGRTLAVLDHPSIARVVRHFEANGTAFLLMTYYPGRTLHELLVRDGPFRPGEIQALLPPLLSALGALEAQGVTHGDIKPANILVTRDGTPVLLDFGAARVAGEAGVPGQATAGSKGYAAVEQTRGQGELGPWTDVYGLAATLYRLITGELPADSALRSNAVNAGRADPLAPLARKRLSRGGFRRGFLAAVDRGLVLLPAERPPGASAWGALLGESVGQDGTRARPRRPGREERVLLPQVLAGVVVLLLLGAAAWLMLERETNVAGQPGVTEESTSSLPVTSLAQDDDSWEQAVRTDTAAGFRAYLEAFPRGRHAHAAREQLARFDQMAWASARDSGLLEPLERYLDSFPDGQFVVEARARVEVLRLAQAEEDARRQAAERVDNQAFDTARAAGTVEALDAYLVAFPGGVNVAEALKLKAGLERDDRDHAAWREAQSADRKDAYQAYLRAFPGGLHLAEALAAVERLTLRPGKVFRDCAACPQMVVVPPGVFQQGAEAAEPGARSNEQPAHTVRFARPFAIGVHEVTFAEWAVCVADGACREQPVDNGWGRDQRPVIMVTWADAQAYAGWLSSRSGATYDLPSESQWEYVARAGQAGPWVGAAATHVCDHGNVAGEETGFEWRHRECRDPFSLGTAPAGYFAANAMGVYDMVGNVAEWTRDCMNLSYLDAPADGSAWERGLCSSRMTRGGSWFSGSAEIRLPARFALRNGESNDFTGFRVVREVHE